MYNFLRNRFNQEIAGFKYENPHQYANDYKQLCSEADDMSKSQNKEKYTKNGWRVVDNIQDKRSNFKGVLYEKDGKYVLAFVGTDKWNYKDHGANLKMASTGDSRQIQEAQKFTETMKAKYGLNSGNTVSIGHSEGGTEATVVGVKNNFKTVTFNAYGISKKQLEPGKDYDNLVTNYRDAHDPVSKLHANVGRTYITPSTQTRFMAKTPFGSIQAHGINKMGDCNESIPLEYYKRDNSKFIDKFSDREISREDIGKMDSDLFKVYEKEIDKKVANNQIKQNVDSGVADGKWVTINGNHVLIKD